jgi:hypothetical protein
VGSIDVTQDHEGKIAVKAITTASVAPRVLALPPCCGDGVHRANQRRAYSWDALEFLGGLASVGATGTGAATNYLAPVPPPDWQVPD